MGCGSGCNGANGSSGISSYYDFQNMCPKNPLDLIAMASINGTAGALANSTLFASETWTDVGSVLKVSTKPVVSALGTDNAQKVADAAQWNFIHLTWNSASTVAFPLRRTMFLRAGAEGTNRITLANTVTVQDPELSFLNNPFIW